MEKILFISNIANKVGKFSMVVALNTSLKFHSLSIVRGKSK